MWHLYFPPWSLSPWEACFSVVLLPSLLPQPGFYYSLWGSEHSESSYSLMWLRLQPRLPAILGSS
ncbi:Transmembrane protein 56, partial [Clarias magur]